MAGMRSTDELGQFKDKVVDRKGHLAKISELDPFYLARMILCRKSVAPLRFEHQISGDLSTFNVEKTHLDLGRVPAARFER